MTIERGTKGLLGLINSKDREDSPRSLSNVLVPVVDAMQFFLLGASATVNNAGIAVAGAKGQSIKLIAGSDPIQVPSGMLRYFDYFTAELVMTGAGQLGVMDSIIHFRQSGASWFTNVMKGANNSRNSYAEQGATTERQVITAERFWLEAGDTLGSMVSTTGVGQVNFYWRYFDIPSN